MPNREIPQRELRNHVSAVLREVEAGATLRVTVRGRAVADLVPVAPRQAHFTPEQVRRIREEAPLDSGFSADVAAVTDGTIDEL